MRLRASVCFSPDGKRGLVGCNQGLIRLWDLETGQEVRQLAGHAGDVQSVQFSPDSRLALSASRDKTVRLWDVATGKEVRRFTGHSDGVESAAFSPDGRRIVSGGSDRVVRLWDVETGAELAHFEGHRDRIWDIAYCPDGRHVLSAAQDKSLRLWRVPFVRLAIGRPVTIKADPALTRLPPPDQATQDRHLDDIHSTYKSKYASKQPAELTALAQKLHQRSGNLQEPERRFVFLQEASKLAARSGDLDLSFRILIELSKDFAVDEVVLKTAALEQAAAVRMRSVSKNLAEKALAVVEEAIREDHYDEGERLVKIVEKASREAGDSPVAALARGKEVARLKKEYAAIAPAVATLAQKSDDPEANRIVGSFCCFHKLDWKRGLPLLAKGEGTLKELAEKDRAGPTTADEQVAVGDGWWQLAQKEKGVPRGSLQQRACYWYQCALADTTESLRARLEKNIDQHQKELPALPSWGHLDLTQATVMSSFVHIPAHKAVLTRESYAGPIDITVVARTAQFDIRMAAAKGAAVIFNWSDNPSELRVTRPDGNDQRGSGSLATAPVAPLKPNVWYTLRWIITERGMAIYVNNSRIFVDRVSYDLSKAFPVQVHNASSDIDVRSVTVRSIRKK